MPANYSEQDLAQHLDEVGRTLADLVEVLADEEDLGRVLQLSTDQVAAAIPGADMVSITMLRDDRAETIAATSETIRAVDQEQYDAGDGPCLEAARTRHMVRADVGEAELRWPVFARRARAAGVHIFLSAPLLIADEFAGSLNLYSERPHGFAAVDVALLRLYVTAAAAAITSARRFDAARAVARQLSEALESRAVIDQAIGLLMAWTGSTPEQASAELSRQSQHTNVKLREVATSLVARPDRPRP